jgi:hypothetical protein
MDKSRVIEVLESYADIYDVRSPANQEIRTAFLEAIELIKEGL